ncbi:MAG: crossover junction endodeoxyribonuclease RuvC [Longicatena sp.]
MQQKYNYYIDASTTRTGITLENTETGEIIITHLDFPKITTKNTTKVEKQFEKFKAIKNILDDFTKKFPYEEIIMEGIFINPAFLNSSEVVIKLHGFLMAYFISTTMTFYPPKSIRKTLLGKGNAKKEEVWEFIKEQYMIECANFDQSDSFAVYLYHKRVQNVEIGKTLPYIIYRQPFTH